MSTPANLTTAQDSITELANLINLPFQPENALWNIGQMGDEDARTTPGPTDYRIEAVLKFSTEDMAQIQNQANAFKLDWEVKWEESYFEAWYPDSVKNSFTLDAETGEYELNGSAYNASTMFTKPPYSTGSFIILNNNEIFLSLSS